ncbi:unnamed protein product [Rotaria socialis]|uniref:Tetratricopeptide repeat protein n=3 Tax=Rotaria socialis TaxID=392032 RepID=A0A820UFT2_9BILA|nr:unnamed protein product [Rotaria socialis]CAF3374939.1 unnamed protein product [Rotaria socialis]CAF3426525.1 unnamed protein product [Rotaria socialis]CAF3635049.1 unnamed protein product [Rotaria socialis]CAF4486427.1 unnamed protein product [Rotaria socialis]
MPKPTKPQPQVEHVENFIIVWLDQSIGHTKHNEQSKTQLQQIVNSVITFTDQKKCHTFMSSIKDEKIFVVVSGKVEENFVSSIHDEKQLESIYILSSDKAKEETWISQYPEISGIYTTMLSLCKQLGKDVKNLDRSLLGFEVMELSLSDTTSKTNQQEALFMYDQLFRDIVLSVSDDSIQDMYEFCEKQYRGNAQEQLFLKTLKQKYSSHSPVWWYSQEAFLYRMVNKALRTHQYDILYLLRVFVRHLHEEIIVKQKEESIGERKLFRGQGMDKETFDRIRLNKGGLLSISNFLSTSLELEAALHFARAALNNKKLVSVLMEITVDKNAVVPLANITDLSAYKMEQEWLFSMGSVFRIGSVECSPEGIWVIPLTFTNDQDEQLNALKEHFKKSMADRNTCLNFAKLMHQLAAWKKSEYFYLMALENETGWQRRSVLFNDLAMVKGELGKYDEALAYYQKSLELKNAEGSDSKTDKATTYNNIATLYHKQKKKDQAIEYFQKAIEACNAQGNTDDGLVATLHANIATILDDQGKYEEALAKSEESLKIRIKIFPAIHPSVASGYGTIANILHSMGSYAKAIEYAQKAVDIDRQALPPDHPQTLLHMNNLEVFKQHQSN